MLSWISGFPTVKVKVTQWHPTLWDPMDSGQNTGVRSLSLLQGIFPTQGSNRGLPHCRQVLYQLNDQRSTNIVCTRITYRGLVKSVGSYTRVSDLVGVTLSLRIYIPNQFPGDTDAATENYRKLTRLFMMTLKIHNFFGN